MSLDEIRAVLAQSPFRPFRLFTTGGNAYDVRHPEMCMLSNQAVVVGILAVGMPGPVYERFAVVDLADVTRLEPLEEPTAGN